MIGFLFLVAINGPRAFGDLEELRSLFSKTTDSIQCMRGESGLPRDLNLYDKSIGGPCPFRVGQEVTSPTNIGLDLLVQLEAIGLGINESRARTNLNLALDSLLKMRYHHPTGLFFSWYTTGLNPQPTFLHLSSVDNFHLAFALWTLWKSDLAPFSQKAGVLFSRMNFNDFYDSKTGLFFGEAHYESDSNTWVIKNWHYAHFGSEARSLSAAAAVLGLTDESYNVDSFKNFIFEKSTVQIKGQQRKLLSLWDGGVFQLFLPEILLGESNYSSFLKENLSDFQDFAQQKGKDEGLRFPLTISAGQIGIGDFACFGEISCYDGHMGHPELVSRMNGAFENSTLKKYWDVAFTPYAFFLTFANTPGLMSSFLPALEHIQIPNFGFADNYHYKGAQKGLRVDAQLALDQGFIALSVAKAIQGTLKSNSLLMNLHGKELKEYYGRIDDAFRWN